MTRKILITYREKKHGNKLSALSKCCKVLRNRRDLVEVTPDFNRKNELVMVDKQGNIYTGKMYMIRPKPKKEPMPGPHPDPFLTGPAIEEDCIP